jgi:DNA-binding protein H-NS
MIQIREQEIQTSATAVEKREEELQKWKEERLQEAQKELEERGTYREKTVEHEAALELLVEALQQPIPTVHDIEQARPASRKGAKNAKGGGVSMATYVENLIGAIEGVAEVPAWKTEKLVSLAHTRTHDAAVQALKDALHIAYEPHPVEEVGGKKPKKGADERPDPVMLLYAAVDHAKSLTGEHTSWKLTAWIERAERHVAAIHIASFDAILNPPEDDEPADTTDPSVIEALQEVLAKIEALNKEPSKEDAAIITKVKMIITAFNELSAENDRATPEPRSGKKKSGRKTGKK